MQMKMVFVQLCVILSAFVASDAVTPVEKVTTLLEGLKKTVEDEGKAEAATYDKFACFCKDTTKAKSTSITEGQDKIDSNTADIGSKSATKQTKITKHGAEQQKVEDTTKKLQETTVAYEGDKAVWQALNADLTKAIGSTKRALKTLSAKKGAALLSLGDQSDVRSVLDLGEALGLVQAGKQQAVATLLQKVDPNDPDYKFHSDKILEILDNLKKDFTDKHTEAQTEWDKTDKSYKAMKKDMEGKITTAKKEITTLSGEIDALAGEIAQHRENLVTAESNLSDDSAYLHDLTSRCENRANEWDQRTQMRNSEVGAFTAALKILKGTVKDSDKVNKRALLIAKSAPAPPAKVVTKAAAPVKKTQAPVKASKPVAAVAKEHKAKSFLEVASKSESFLSRVERVQMLVNQDRVVEFLKHEGVRLNSAMLTSVVTKIQADPFGKVKKLIQGLVERLLEESKNEATKKGFCDTELGKSYSTRDSKFSETNKLDASLAELAARKEELTVEIKELGENVVALNESLKEATTLRADSKKENAETLKTAQDGAKAVANAAAILKDFYKTAAKAALVQISASPVDEDTAGAGFKGSYTGSQDASKAILGLLATIQSDFERTIRTTEATEEKDAAEFVLFDRSSKADIKGKETKVVLDNQDLDSTKTAMDEALKDLKTAQNLLDLALKNIEELKPTCIDTGMSYAERVQKREDEVKALSKAVCMLDSEKVEPECQ